MSLLVLLGEKNEPVVLPSGQLLATWGQYSTYVDANGRYRVIWQYGDGEVRMQKFETVKTILELEHYFADIKADAWFGGIQRLPIEWIDDNIDLIKEVVYQIRIHPELTLTQYYNYLNTKEWYEQVIIKTFIFKLALGLAEYHGVTLSDYTEIEVLTRVRNWICSVDLNILKRVVFGYLIAM